MEIVIKISEHNKNVIDRFVNGEGFEVLPTPIVDDVIRAVRNGKVLPKGHKRLIEDNFEVGPVFDEEGNRTGYKYLTQEDLNNALTIIPADIEDIR